jgi:hypothetical protein
VRNPRDACCDYGDTEEDGKRNDQTCSSHLTDGWNGVALTSLHPYFTNTNIFTLWKGWRTERSAMQAGTVRHVQWALLPASRQFFEGSLTSFLSFDTSMMVLMRSRCTRTERIAKQPNPPDLLEPPCRCAGWHSRAPSPLSRLIQPLGRFRSAPIQEERGRTRNDPQPA